MKIPGTRAVLACVALFAAIAQFSSSATAAGAAVSDAWVRYVPGGAPSAGYFRLRNDADKPLKLTGAECADFGMAMMHRTIEHGGVATMEPVAEITLAPGKTVSFAPGGYHLMLVHPKHPLRPGGRLPITLRFADGSRLSAEFLVESLGAR